MKYKNVLTGSFNPFLRLIIRKGGMTLGLNIGDFNENKKLNKINTQIIV